MRTQTEIQIEIEATDKAVSALKTERSAMPKNEESLAASRLDEEIEEGLGRIATLNDEWIAAK
jgi:predicted N-acetyltransferase YhbS